MAVEFQLQCGQHVGPAEERCGWGRGEGGVAEKLRAREAK